MMRRIRRVVGMVDARRIDADEADSPIEEKVRPGFRQSGTVEQVRGGAPMPLPPAGAEQDCVPLPDGAARCTHGGPQVLGQDPAFLRNAAKVEDMARCDESIDRQLMELAPLRLEMERRIDVRAGVTDQEHGFREEPVDLACRRCPRLVRYRERVARTKRAAFRDWEYWGRPVPGFGDPDAEVLIVGLAPAAHGGNRTGRTFTGDRSGEFLYRTLYRAGFANQATSVSKDDGLVLRDCYIAAAVRCAPPQNKPTRIEFARCQPYLEREVVLLRRLRVVVVLGAVAMQAFLRTWRATGHDLPSPVPKFRHGGTWLLPPVTLIATYHPSQRNTQTGRLTQSMLDRVFESAQTVRSTDHTR